VRRFRITKKSEATLGNLKGGYNRRKNGET
jgi:hypothetical protein